MHDEKRVKVRKDHACSYCSKPIPKGSVVKVESGLYENEFYRRYQCGECEPLVDAFWEYVCYECEGPIPESFAEFKESVGVGVRKPKGGVMDDLKPCPFCGGDAHLRTKTRYRNNERHPTATIGELQGSAGDES